VDLSTLDAFRQTLKKLERTLREHPDAVLSSLKLLDGKEAGFPDLVYMALDDRERLIRRAAESAMLEVWELMMLYGAVHHNDCGTS
jgi:hypothetical protein